MTMPSPAFAGDDDVELRRAVKTAALAYEPPSDLAERTLARVAAEPVTGQGRRGDRLGARRSWLIAAAVLVLLGVVGSVATRVPVGPIADSASSGARPVSGSGGGEDKATGQPIDTDLDGGAGRDDSATAGTADAGGAKSLAPNAGPAPPVPAPALAAQGPGTDANLGGGGAAGALPSGAAVVRTASLELRVPNGRFNERWRQAEAVAGTRGGFVTSSTAEEVRGRLARGTLALRVPAAQLPAALADLRRLGTVVQSTTGAEDVSAQVVDLDARLRVARANEEQLIEVLSQARSVGDGLAVRDRLNQVRTEVEALQGQRARLQGQVELATVTAVVYEREAAPPRAREEENRLVRGWHQAGDAAAATVAGMMVVAGWAGPLAVLGLLAWAAARRWRRRLS